MARCLLVSKDIDIAPNGIDPQVSMRFMFDVNPPDLFDVVITATDGMTKTQFQTKVRNAIQAEATRAGRTWNGNVIILEDLLSGI